MTTTGRHSILPHAEVLALNDDSFTEIACTPTQYAALYTKPPSVLR